MGQVNLYYLSGNNYGGWVSYTLHLIEALRAAGADVQLWKMGNRTEEFERVFAKTSYKYRNTTLDDALKRRGKHLIVVLAKNQVQFGEALMKKKRARIIVHDAVEGRFYDDLPFKRPFLVRANLVEHYPDGIFIPQPFHRAYPNQSTLSGHNKREFNAVSLSRIDFDKNTDILLEANELLSKKFQIDIRGFENRLYTKFNILPRFPYWEQSKRAFSNDINSGSHIARTAKFMVDLTEIKGDGGGTQYTYMEAMDAGTICVVHTSWLDKKGPMKNIGIPVGDAKDLAKLLRDRGESKFTPYVQAGYRLLNKHSPKKVGKLFLEQL